MSLRISGKYSIIDIKSDFSRGFGAQDFKTINSSLWESLIVWLNSLPSHEYEVVAKYYIKIKYFCKNNQYLEKSLKLYFLFKIRLERIIHPERNIESISFNIYIKTSNLSKLRSIDIVMSNLYKCSNCIDPSEIHKINDWDPKYFTDPRSFANQQNIDNFRFLIHPISEENYSSKEFINVEESFKNNDAILLCLISEKHRYFCKRLSVILSVPKQNILSTYNSNESVTHLLTPDEIIENSILQKTEVIVCGRVGVNIHPRFPTSAGIKVIGIMIAIDKNEEISSSEYEKTEKFSLRMKRKYGVPIIKAEGFLDCAKNVN